MEIGHSYHGDSGNVHCSAFYLIRNDVFVSHNVLSPLHKPVVYLEHSQHLLT